MITTSVKNELIAAIQEHRSLAKLLIAKLLSETKMDTELLDKKELRDYNNGKLFYIHNPALKEEKQYLSGNWVFFYNVDDMSFRNLETDQSIRVDIIFDDYENHLDPYFFYIFLETTTHLKHLCSYFPNPFQNMCDFFDVLIEEKQMTENNFWIMN